jgi:hypothetical protein
VAQLIVKKYLVTLPIETNELHATTQGSQGFGSTGIALVDFMPLATEATIKGHDPSEYHEFLDIFDPSGPTKQLPPSHPGYDFKIRLDLDKPLPPPA